MFEAGFAQILSPHHCCLSLTTFLCFPCPQGTSRLLGVLSSWPHSWAGGRSPWACSQPCPALGHSHSDQDLGAACKACAQSSGVSCKGLRATSSFSARGICSCFVEHRDKETQELCSPIKTPCAVSPHLVAALAACPCCSISPHQFVPPLVSCPCSFKHPKMFLLPCPAFSSVCVLLDITSTAPNRSHERCCCCLIAIYFSHSSSPHRHYVKNAFHINPNFSICWTGLKRSEELSVNQSPQQIPAGESSLCRAGARPDNISGIYFNLTMCTSR